MDTQSKENKVWVDRLRYDTHHTQLDEALAERGLIAEEIRLLPRGRAVLIFTEKSDAKACLNERDVFRHLGCTNESWGQLLKYQPGFEDNMFRGQTNLVEERLNKDICDLFMQSRDTLTKLAEQYKITWFYSTLHGLFLRGPAEAVKEASVYLNNNVSCDNCRCPTATVSQASGYHDNNVIKVTRNEPTVAAVKQTSGNVNSKSSDRFRGHDNCPTTPAVVLQPDGTMVAKVNKKKCLPGYKSHGTIVVAYDFPAGVQGENNPRPGRPYAAQTFTTYVPDSDEGRAVVRLLNKAFDQKLLFVIVWLATGTDKIVLKDSVRHKMKVNGGVENNAYPDPDYLADVTKDLAAIGISQ